MNSTVAVEPTVASAITEETKKEAKENAADRVLASENVLVPENVVVPDPGIEREDLDVIKNPNKKISAFFHVN